MKKTARTLITTDVACSDDARALTDGSAVADVSYKTEEWLLSEVLADRGDTIVLEPQRLRDAVAKRARRLLRESARVPTQRP